VARRHAGLRSLPTTGDTRKRGCPTERKPALEVPICAVALCSLLLQIRVFVAALWSNGGAADIHG
jgi:hypothetical protein